MRSRRKVLPFIWRRGRLLEAAERAKAAKEAEAESKENTNLSFSMAALRAHLCDIPEAEAVAGFRWYYRRLTAVGERAKPESQTQPRRAPVIDIRTRAKGGAE